MKTMEPLREIHIGINMFAERTGIVAELERIAGGKDIYAYRAVKMLLDRVFHERGWCMDRLVALAKEGESPEIRLKAARKLFKESMLLY